MFCLTASSLFQIDFSTVKGNPSLLAALDYFLCLESAFFVPSATGNFANLITGHRFVSSVLTPPFYCVTPCLLTISPEFCRLFLSKGPTLQPDLKRIAQAFACTNSDIMQTQQLIKYSHEDRLFPPLTRAIPQSFFGNPSECLCAS